MSVLAGEEFDVREARILGTALVALVAGGAALAGLATAREEPRGPLGWVVVGLAAAAGVALLVGIWWEAGWDRHGERMGRVVLSAAMLLLGAVVVGTLRRALRLDLAAVRAAFWAEVALVGATVLFALAAIWIPSVDDVGRQTSRVDLVERVLVALFVLFVAGFLLLPALERALGSLAQRGRRVDRGAA